METRPLILEFSLRVIASWGWSACESSWHVSCLVSEDGMQVLGEDWERVVVV